MADQSSAVETADRQVRAVRDDPDARLALLARTYRGPEDRVVRHLPYRAAALSFMRWQHRRGVLNPLDCELPGSPWWRGINERLLRDGCEAVAIAGGAPGQPSSSAVELWGLFVEKPTASTWYRAHNASIISAYLACQEDADAENAPERFFMNVALIRVLFAHALVSAPRLALGALAPLGVVGDPRLGTAGLFLSLGRVLPDDYPLRGELADYLTRENRFSRVLDYAVIAPKSQLLYEWSAVATNEPQLVDLVQQGSPVYAWPYEQREVWKSTAVPRAARLIEQATRPRGKQQMSAPN